MNSFYCVKSQSQHEIIISKSRFICTLIPIIDINDAIKNLAIIKKKYSDATHNCYAVISDNSFNEQKFSDDGEPQGTAGIPMLQVLKVKKVCKTLAVVTRYFGGTKLGAGGLVGAYTRCVVEALENATLCNMQFAAVYVAKFDYTCYQKIQSLFKDKNVGIISLGFEDCVQLEFAILPETEKDIINAISEISLGSSNINKIEDKYIDFSKEV